MRSHRHRVPPTRSALSRTLMPLVLVGLLWGCGGDEPPDRPSTRTGGIFGGTPAPSTPRSSPPPASAGEQATPPSGERASPAPSSGSDRRGAGADRSAPPPSERGSVTVDFSGLGYTEGSPDAPIRVIEFSDFGCGYCRKFHVETYPTLREEYVETGKVRWKYIPFVLGIFPNGVEAARAGECAIAQGDFPPFRDRLFEDQSAWREADEPLDVFVRLAREEGLDAERLRACYEERRPEDRVRRNIELGRRVGVRGTPTFLVEGHPVQGALPMEVFREFFDRMLQVPAVTGEGTQGGEE